jgi:hypothetical protein
MPWNPVRRTPATLISGATLAAVTGVLAAWPSGPHPAAHRHPAARTHPAPVPPATLPRVSCGSAVTQTVSHGSNVVQRYSAAPGALACFNRAARECRAASIAVSENEVDTGTTYVFVIEPGGVPCRVTELMQAYSASNGGSDGPVGSAPCRRTAVTASGVTLNCGGPDILIPAKVTAKIPDAAVP